MNEQKDNLQLLSEIGNFWVVNWNLVQKFNSIKNENGKPIGGLNEGVIFGYLCSIERYWKSKGKSEFYCTRETMQKATTIEPRQQKKAIDNLVNAKLLTVYYKGVPPLRYFKINRQALEDTLKDNAEYDDSG